MSTLPTLCIMGKLDLHLCHHQHSVKIDVDVDSIADVTYKA